MFLISIPLRARGRWIEASDAGITSSWGESFQFDEVELVNKRKWRSKGIAKVTYVANNRRRSFVVDDYKFDRYADRRDSVRAGAADRRWAESPTARRSRRRKGQVQQIIEASSRATAAPASDRRIVARRHEVVGVGGFSGLTCLQQSDSAATTPLAVFRRINGFPAETPLAAAAVFQ